MIKPNLTMGDSNPDTIKRLLGHPTASFKGLEPLKVELGEHPIHKPETVEVPVHGVSDPIKAEMPIEAEAVATSPSMESVKKDQEMKMDIHKNDSNYSNVEQRELDAYSFIENSIEDAYSEDTNTIEDNYAVVDKAVNAIHSARLGASKLGEAVGGKGKYASKVAAEQRRKDIIKGAAGIIGQKTGYDKDQINMVGQAAAPYVASAGKSTVKGVKKLRKRFK
jgi:hypothetical protein